MPTMWGEISLLENALENVEFLISCQEPPPPVYIQERDKIQVRLNLLLDKAYEETVWVNSQFKEF
jgi:hypothetical protein